jgi:putative transposase
LKQLVADQALDIQMLKYVAEGNWYTRECLCLKVDRSITSEDVIDTLAELFAMRGVPRHIRSDNGPEFIAHAIQRWTTQLEIETLYIEPGAPWENGYAESFHSHFRDEFLATEVFENLATARKLTAAWKEDYNHYRPHSSLGYRTPAEFAARCPASAPKLLSATPPATSPLQQDSDLTQPVLS